MATLCSKYRMDKTTQGRGGVHTLKAICEWNKTWCPVEYGMESPQGLMRATTYWSWKTSETIHLTFPPKINSWLKCHHTQKENYKNGISWKWLNDLIQWGPILLVGIPETKPHALLKCHANPIPCPISCLLSAAMHTRWPPLIQYTFPQVWH